jgi:hypothetical protein
VQSLPAGSAAGWGAAGPVVADSGVADPAVHEVPERPGKDDLAEPMAALERGDPSNRLVVAGTDADLAAVVLRLVRTERLADVAVAYLPADSRSAVAAIWSLPTDPARAADLALRGDPDAVPLVRDDSGGVLLGRGELAPMRGVVWCDDQLVMRGQASRLEVTPSAPDGVAVRAARIGVLGLRSSSAVGRAVQVGCMPAGVTCDGVPHDRPVTRWTWYRHTEPLRLVRGLPAA